MGSPAEADRQTDSEGESFAVAAHKIRGALTSVVGYSARLHASVRSGAFPAGEEHAEAIELLAQGADRLRDAIEGLFTIEELSRGTLEVEVDPLPLARVVEGEVKRARERHQALSVSLVCDDQAVVESDARHIRRILRTLLDNAATHAGAAPAADVALAATPEGGATIAVRDHGPGLPEEARGTVFAREYLKDGVVHYRTGLGLYLASRLAERLGGHLTLEEPASGAGGAAFVLTLPAVGPEEA